MILQKIAFVIIAKLIIAQGRISDGEGDHKDKNLEFKPEMTSKELLDFCHSHSTYVRDTCSQRIRRKSTLDLNWTNHRANSENGLRVRVLQWNILSDVLGLYKDNFSRCPTEALEWVYRRCLILDEMFAYEPDVMCLQEVDHFDFFNRALATQSYSGVFVPKKRTPCIGIKGNNGPDGLAIFYNNNKYELLEKHKWNFYHLARGSRQVALLVILRDKSSGVKFCVATTHLKSQKGIRESALRNKQGEDLLKFVSKHAKRCPTIITGDFNAEPIEPVYKTMCSNPKFRLDSAYNLHGKESEYTTWKIRAEEGEVKETLDYIFYTPKYLAVSTIITMPEEKSVDENRFPSFAYPSDHLSLIADFTFNKIHITTDLIDQILSYIEDLQSLFTTIIKKLYTKK